MLSSNMILLVNFDSIEWWWLLFEFWLVDCVDCKTW